MTNGLGSAGHVGLMGQLRLRVQRQWLTQGRSGGQQCDREPGSAQAVFCDTTWCCGALQQILLGLPQQRTLRSNCACKCIKLYHQVHSYMSWLKIGCLSQGWFALHMSTMTMHSNFSNGTIYQSQLQERPVNFVKVNMESMQLPQQLTHIIADMHVPVHTWQSSCLRCFNPCLKQCTAVIETLCWPVIIPSGSLQANLIISAASCNCLTNCA